MNRIAVITHFDGHQTLKTIKEIFSIGAKYKQERRRLRALSEWCAWNRVDRIDRMKFEGYPLFIVGTGTEIDISEKDVRMWIGLKTNVSRISNAAFDKRMRERAGR